MQNSKTKIPAVKPIDTAGKWSGDRIRHTFVLPESQWANPQPGGYLAGGDLFWADGKLSRRKTQGARFVGNLFVVDKRGQVWLGVRRSVWAVPGAACQWYATKIESGRTKNGTPAPENWHEFVCAPLVIPLFLTLATRKRIETLIEDMSGNLKHWNHEPSQKSGRGADGVFELTLSSNLLGNQ